MKKQLLLIAAILLFPFFMTAQHINGFPLDSIKTAYLEMTTYSTTTFTMQSAISLDFGQVRQRGNQTVLKNEFDEPIRFNSMLDAVNYMRAHNYELDQVYVTSGSSVHYILRRMTGN
jgi:hypothetical protein